MMTALYVLGGLTLLGAAVVVAVSWRQAIEERRAERLAQLAAEAEWHRKFEQALAACTAAHGAVAGLSRDSKAKPEGAAEVAAKGGAGPQ